MVREELNIELLLLFVEKSLLRWLGHIIKISEGQILSARRLPVSRPRHSTGGRRNSSSCAKEVGPTMDGCR